MGHKLQFSPQSEKDKSFLQKSFMVLQFCWSERKQQKRDRLFRPGFHTANGNPIISTNMLIFCELIVGLRNPLEEIMTDSGVDH